MFPSSSRARAGPAKSWSPAQSINMVIGPRRHSWLSTDRRRIGKFEQCNGGTLLLDEIGDMPLASQGKILRLLQEQAFERVGGNETIQTDVRVIAATNRDLKAFS